MHESSKRGGGAPVIPQRGLGVLTLSQRVERAGHRLGPVELRVERSLDALSAAAIQVDGLRGIKLA